MALQYVVTPLPTVWPGPKVYAKRSPFKTQWTKTLGMLEREIKHLGGSHVEFAVDVRGPRDINQNGTLRADARPQSRVIVSFRQRDGKRLQFPCGTFTFWQDKVYAIAKALEALRMVERYGVSSTSQYEGFKALPAAGQSTPTMTLDVAATVLSNYHPSLTPLEVVRNRDAATSALRSARAKAHPDVNGGDHSKWDVVETARQVLGSHHGVSL